MDEKERRTRHIEAMGRIEAEWQQRRAEALALLIPVRGGQDDK